MQEWAVKFTAQSGEADFRRTAFRIDIKLKHLKYCVVKCIPVWYIIPKSIYVTNAFHHNKFIRHIKSATCFGPTDHPQALDTWYLKITGDRLSTVVKVLCYKSEGRWFDPRWCHWKFSLT